MNASDGEGDDDVALVASLDDTIDSYPSRPAPEDLRVLARLHLRRARAVERCRTEDSVIEALAWIGHKDRAVRLADLQPSWGFSARPGWVAPMRRVGLALREKGDPDGDELLESVAIALETSRPIWANAIGDLAELARTRAEAGRFEAAMRALSAMPPQNTGDARGIAAAIHVAAAMHRAGRVAEAGELSATTVRLNGDALRPVAMAAIVDAPAELPVAMDLLVDRVVAASRNPVQDVGRGAFSGLELLVAALQRRGRGSIALEVLRACGYLAERASAEATPDLLSDIARALARAGRADDALELLERRSSLEGASVRVRAASIAASAVDGHVDRGDLRGAVSGLDAIECACSRSEAAMRVVVGLARAGQGDAARELFARESNRAVDERTPSTPPFAFELNLGVVAALAGRAKAASALFTSALARAREDCREMIEDDECGGVEDRFVMLADALDRAGHTGTMFAAREEVLEQAGRSRGRQPTMPSGEQLDAWIHSAGSGRGLGAASNWSALATALARASRRAEARRLFQRAWGAAIAVDESDRSVADLRSYEMRRIGQAMARAGFIEDAREVEQAVGWAKIDPACADSLAAQGELATAFSYLRELSPERLATHLVAWAPHFEAAARGLALEVARDVLADLASEHPSWEMMRWTMEQVTPVTLVATGVGVLAVDEEALYWTSTGRIMRLARSGGEAQQIARCDHGIESLAVDATHVYWCEERGGAVRRVARTGGEPTAIVTGEVNPWLVRLDEDAVYWCNDDHGFADSPPICLKKLSKRDFLVATLAGEPLAEYGGLTLDRDALYWLGERGLMTMPKAGGSPLVLVPGEGWGKLDLLAVGGRRLYWTGLDRLWAADRSGGDVVALAIDGEVTGLEADGQFVFWSDRRGINAAPEPGGPPRVLVERASARLAAIDAGKLYFVDRDGALHAIEKPSC